MIEIIKRHEGYKSENMQLDGQRAQISYNSDGHLCIRLLQADPEQDTLVVLGATTSHEVIRFLLRARDNDIPLPF